MTSTTTRLCYSEEAATRNLASPSAGRGGMILALVAALLLAVSASAAHAAVPAEGCYFEGLRLMEAGKPKPALQWLRRTLVAPQVNLATGAYRHIAHRRELMQLLINEGVSGADPSFNIEKFHQALVARAHTRIAEMLMRDAAFDEAARELERAKLADPSSPCRSIHSTRKRSRTTVGCCSRARRSCRSV